LSVLHGLLDALGKVIDNLDSANQPLLLELVLVRGLSDALLSELVGDIIQHIVKFRENDWHGLVWVMKERLELVELLKLLEGALGQVHQDNRDKWVHLTFVLHVLEENVCFYTVLDTWHIYYI
jgi:hypothetical protein